MLPLSVQFISTSFPSGSADWRARFIWDMVESLAAKQEMQISLWAPPGELPVGVQSSLTEKDAHLLRKITRAGGIAHLLRARPICAVLPAANLLKALRSCYRRSNQDVLHINWLQNALPLPTEDTRPVLVTVLGSDYRWLSLPGVVRRLRKVLSVRKSIIAPNAEWMVPTLDRLFGDIAQVHALPFGIHDDWYSLERTENACSANKWLTVSRVTRGKIGDLFSWGEGLFDSNIQLHLLGPKQEQSLTVPEWVHFHGPTFPEELQSRWFPNAAGLISLSRHDEGRPQVMLEAMASGLPIIASDLPAHRDIIRPGVTGWLVNSQEEFRKALDYLSVPENNRGMGDAARIIAKERYGTWKDCANRYQAAYHELRHGTK